MGRLPAEYERHAATIMIWPEREGSWPYKAKYAEPVFAEAIKNIAKGETVILNCSHEAKERAEVLLSKQIRAGVVRFSHIKTDDCWARDIGPVFVEREDTLWGFDFSFNAWGGKEDGLYRDYKRDDKFARAICKKSKILFERKNFVLEGGSICSNGKGTLITTEECLLSAGRNPRLSKIEIEKKLKAYFDLERVVWLPYGYLGDETNGHVDNVCAFVDENKVVLAWDEDGEQAERCRKNFNALRAEGISIVKLPLPKNEAFVTEDDMLGYKFKKGEAKREVGERLVSSYCNFYVANACVLVPAFGDECDDDALKIVGGLFPDRRAVALPAQALVRGGGNIHCLTMQMPYVKERK